VEIAVAECDDPGQAAHPVGPAEREVIMKIGLSKPSSAMAVALVALFVALGGGSYAAVKLGDGGNSRGAGTLKSGETLKGLYQVSDFDSGSNSSQFAENVITYQRPLKFVPQVHFIPQGGSEVPECPGTTQKPKADGGHLCVYEADDGQRDLVDVPFLAGNASDKLGFGVSVLSAASQNGLYYSKGSWAVTAP
jgi:hypothetical protein